MHSALLIDEILENVLRNFLDWELREHRWTLAQIARSCKAWRDPALDKIWMQLDDIHPIINTLDVSLSFSSIPCHANVYRYSHQMNIRTQPE